MFLTLTLGPWLTILVQICYFLLQIIILHHIFQSKNSRNNSFHKMRLTSNNQTSIVMSSKRTNIKLIKKHEKSIIFLFFFIQCSVKRKFSIAIYLSHEILLLKYFIIFSIDSLFQLIFFRFSILFFFVPFLISLGDSL